jgi:type II secretory ATPase GspE/PulE/Tfp pilus assembly ATPase PilB-like protein
VVKCIKYVEHDFKDEIQDYTFNNEQLKVFELLIKQSTSLHILEGTLGSGKIFLIKYLTQYSQMQNKNVLLTTTTGAVVLRLSQNA